MKLTMIISVLLLLSATALTGATADGSVCTDKYQADVFVLIDSSNSLPNIGFEREKNFTAHLCDDLPLGPNDVHFGFGQFSTVFEGRLDLGSSYDKDLIKQVIYSTQHLKGITRTDIAFTELNEKKHLTGHGRRPGAKLILVVTTDGQSTYPDLTAKEAAKIRALGATIFVFTLGNKNDTEANIIAGDPNNVFSLKSMADLEKFRPQLVARVCEEASKTTTAAPTEAPTPAPTEAPTPAPTPAPTEAPTPAPTEAPTPAPTEAPTPAPTEAPTEAPTAAPTPAPTSAPSCPPDRAVDVVFVVDASSSIGLENFQKARDFVECACDEIFIDGGNNRVGEISYGTHAYRATGLTNNKTEAKQAAKKLSYRNSSTRTNEGIKEGVKIYNESYNPDAAQVMVLMTDGESSFPDQTQIEADTAKDLGIFVIVIGIGSQVNPIELRQIASEGSYIPIANYSELQKAIGKVVKAACDAPPKVKPCPPGKPIDLAIVVDSSSSIGAKYFHFNADLIKKFIAAFVIGPNDTRIALLTYGTHTRKQFSVTGDPAVIDKGINNMPYQASTTHTERGLRDAKTELDNNGRNGNKKVILLITDGKSTVPEETKLAADECKKAGVTIVVVAVGDDCSSEELSYVSSDHTYIKAADYERLPRVAAELADRVCDEAKA